MLWGSKKNNRQHDPRQTFEEKQRNPWELMTSQFEHLVNLSKRTEQMELQHKALMEAMATQATVIAAQTAAIQNLADSNKELAGVLMQLIVAEPDEQQHDEPNASHVGMSDSRGGYLTKNDLVVSPDMREACKTWPPGHTVVGDVAKHMAARPSSDVL